MNLFNFIITRYIAKWNRSVLCALFW